MKPIPTHTRIFHWWQHLFYMIGLIYFNLLQFDFQTAKECGYWVIIHLAHDGELTEIVEITFKQKVEVMLTALFGLSVTVGLLAGVVELIKKML